MKKNLLSLLLGLIFVTSGFSQTQFWSDTFEDVGAPSTGARSPSIAEFSCQSGATFIATSYFKRTDLASITLQSGTYSNIEGSKFWAAEDIDTGGGAVGSCVNNSISPNQQVTWNSINISGKTGLSFKGLFAANHLQGGNWEGSNFAPNQDFVAVEYRIDGGTWTKAIVFYASGVANTNTLKLETTGDLIGDGADLTYTLTEYTATIPATGTTLDLRLNCSANGTQTEEIAIDNFRLFSIIAAAPTVTTTAATTIGAVKATLAGNVTADGGATVTERGVVWATTANPTTANNKVIIGSGTGTFSQLVTGLPAGTLVNFRAYAINSVGTSYGSNLTFTTNVALSASQNQTNVACNGGSNGAGTVVASGGVSPYTYLWSPSGGTAATATGRTAGAYTCTITDSESTQLVKNFTIIQPTVLTATASSQTNVSCNGGSNGSATVSASGGTPGYTYSWAPSGGSAATASGLSSGTYTVTVTDANSCTKTQSFTITQPSAINNSVTQLSGVLTATQTGATYQWYTCPSTLLTGATNQSYTPTVVGDYKVVVTLGSCNVTSICTTVTALGNESFVIKGLSVYPNPFTNVFTIALEEEATATIFDIIGKQIGKQIGNQKLSSGNNTIDLSDSASGMYLVKLSTDNGSKILKMVKN